MSITKLKALNNSIARLVLQRNAVLVEVRRNCKHVRLIELNYRPSCFGLGANPPRRICIRCGAEEDGWGCGYKVLATSADSTITPYRAQRAVVERTNDGSKFYSYRKKGPPYFVGQNHPNFAGAGRKTYEQLTEIVE